MVNFKTPNGKFVFKAKAQASGERCIYLQYVLNGKPIFRTTGLAVREQDWDPAKQQIVKCANGDVKRLNYQLKAFKTRVDTQMLQYVNNGHILTSNIIKQMLEGTFKTKENACKIDLVQYALEYNEHRYEGQEITEKTRYNHEKTIMAFAKYLDNEYGDSFLPFSSLTLSHFDWDEYVTRLTVEGYDVQLHRDTEGKVHGYAIRMSNSIYKSSVLGHSRNLMPSKIEDTWAGLHSQKPAKTVKPDTEAAQEPARTGTEINIIRMKLGGNACEIRISDDVVVEMGNEIRKMEADPKSDAFSHTAKTAVLLFANFINEATNFAENCGGGGTSPSSDWGRDKDEEDLEWARRCAGWLMI